MSDLVQLLETIRTETRPIDGHSDPGAIEDVWRMVFEELSKQATTPTCMDCGAPYPFALDTALSNEEWAMIHPDKYGLLCANCIVCRASRLPDVVIVKMKLVFADDYDKGGQP
jgi:hypothetical protein